MNYIGNMCSIACACHPLLMYDSESIIPFKNAYGKKIRGGIKKF